MKAEIMYLFIERELPLLQAYLRTFSAKDIFYADEFCIFSTTALDRTIAKRRLERKK